MIINCRASFWKPPTEEEDANRRKHVFVDGVKIQHVWFCDTESGIVKTYDILGDGSIHSVREIGQLAFRLTSRFHYELLPDGPISRTIIGRVELKDPEVTK